MYVIDGWMDIIYGGRKVYSITTYEHKHREAVPAAVRLAAIRFCVWANRCNPLNIHIYIY